VTREPPASVDERASDLAPSRTGNTLGESDRVECRKPMRPWVLPPPRASLRKGVRVGAVRRRHPVMMPDVVAVSGWLGAARLRSVSTVPHAPRDLSITTRHSAGRRLRTARRTCRYRASPPCERVTAKRFLNHGWGTVGWIPTIDVVGSTMGVAAVVATGLSVTTTSTSTQLDPAGWAHATVGMSSEERPGFSARKTPSPALLTCFRTAGFDDVALGHPSLAGFTATLWPTWTRTGPCTKPMTPSSPPRVVACPSTSTYGTFWRAR